VEKRIAELYNMQLYEVGLGLGVNALKHSKFSTICLQHASSA